MMLILLGNLSGKGLINAQNILAFTVVSDRHPHVNIQIIKGKQVGKASESI